MKKMPSAADKSEIVIYTASDGTVQTEVRLQAETLWLNQSQLEELFATERTSLVKHMNSQGTSGSGLHHQSEAPAGTAETDSEIQRIYPHSRTRPPG